MLNTDKLSVEHCSTLRLVVLIVEMICNVSLAGGICVIPVEIGSLLLRSWGVI